MSNVDILDKVTLNPLFYSSNTFNNKIFTVIGFADNAKRRAYIFDSIREKVRVIESWHLKKATKEELSIDGRIFLGRRL